MIANSSIAFGGSSGESTACSFNYTITLYNSTIAGATLEDGCGFQFSETLSLNFTLRGIHLKAGSAILAPSVELIGAIIEVDATSVINASCGAPGDWQGQGYALNGGGGSHLGQGGAL